MPPKELIEIEDAGSESNGNVAPSRLRNPQSNEIATFSSFASLGIPPAPGLNLLKVTGSLPPTLTPGAKSVCTKPNPDRSVTVMTSACTRNGPAQSQTAQERRPIPIIR